LIDFGEGIDYRTLKDIPWHLTRRSFHDDAEANVRAKRLIYLVENKLTVAETHRV